MKHTIIILITILSVGCQAQRLPTATPTATAVSLTTTPVPTAIFTPTAVSTPTPLPTSTATTSPPPTTIAKTPTIPEHQPTRTPRPTLTPFPTAPPTATSPPPLNVAELVEQLAFETIEGENGRSLTQLHVSEYGLRHQYYCEQGPFHWLDDGHLMLFPVVGYTSWYENPTMGQVTQPVIVSLDGSVPWAADISPTDVCNLPVWSAALQQVIEAGVSQVRLRDLQGSITETYDGQMPLFLAPSGHRLLAGFTWIDLTTGETVSLENHGRVKFPQPAWTTDETRFFECCFGYGDMLTGTYQSRESYPGFWIGGVGVGPGYSGSRPRWVANDALVMIEPSNMSFLRESNQPVVPVIDPDQQTYVDVVEQLGLPDTVVTCGPFISPDGSAFWLSCSEWKDDVTIQQYDPSFLVMLPSLETMSVTGKIEFRGWSADSRFMAFTKLADTDAGTGTTWLMDTGGSQQQIADEAARLAHWHDVDPLVALRFDDQRRLQFVHAETDAGRTVELDAPVLSVAWQPVDSGVVVVDENGRIWWLPDPFNPALEPELLTPPMPAVHSLRWSPNGDRLAFVSETNLYVVSLEED